LPTPEPASASSPNNSQNTVDYGNGVVNSSGSNSGTSQSNQSAGQRTLSQMSTEKISGFAPGAGLRIEVFGSRTTGQFVVAPGNVADPVAIAAALEESRNRRVANFAGVTNAQAVPTPPNENIIGGSPTNDAIETFAASGLANPITVSDLPLLPNSQWIRVDAQVDGYKSGTVVYLAVTTQPVIFGAAVVDKFGKANFSGYLPVDALASGGHDIRVVGLRELDGVSTDENGEIVLAESTLAEIQRFDEGTKATVKISGPNLSGGVNLAIREIPLLKIKPWWTIWLLLCTIALVGIAYRYRKIVTLREQLIARVIILIATLPALILGWTTSSYDVMGIGAVLAIVGAFVGRWVPRKRITEARRAQ